MIHPGKKPSFSGKYLVARRVVAFALWCFDMIAAVLRKPNRGRHPQGPVRRVLLCNLAHLGDVVIATGVLPVVKELYPEAQIGFLLGSHSLQVLARHPLITYLHTADHWKLSRSGKSLWRRILSWHRTKRRAVRELVAIGYDVAIDLYPFFPNAISILWKAKIPVRAGFTSGGLGPWLTHPSPWQEQECSLVYHQFILLKTLGAKEEWKKWLKLSLPTPPDDVFWQVGERLRPFGRRPYVVIHMGSAMQAKEWLPSRWRSLARRLLTQGYEVAFTGQGAREKAMVATVQEGLKGTYSLVDTLSWEEFVAVIAKAEALYGVDSLAGHLAAAMETPSISLFTGIQPTAVWRPFGMHNEAIMAPVTCAPCRRKRGCAEMACIQKIGARHIPIDFWKA